MNSDLYTKLFIIESKILRQDFFSESKEVKNWGGADVIIARRITPATANWLGDTSLVIDFNSFQGGKVAVITRYSKELSWLFEQFRDNLKGYIDYANKYEYYGRLAFYAMKYLKSNPTEKDCKTFLMYVFSNMREFLDNEYSK